MGSPTSIRVAAPYRSAAATAQLEMDALVADVTGAVSCRTDANIERARKIARHLERIADIVRPFESIDYESSLKTAEFYHLRPVIFSVVRLGGELRAHFQPFVLEHGALLSKDVVGGIESFLRWCDEVPAVVAALWERYVRELEQDIADVSDEYGRVAEEWSGVDADGLDEPVTG